LFLQKQKRKIVPEIIPEIVPEIVPEITPEIVPEIIPEIVPEITPEIVPDNTKENEGEKFYSIKEGMLSSPYYPRKMQYLRERRNALLQATDFYLLPDVVIDEKKLNAIKIYRQETSTKLVPVYTEDFPFLPSPLILFWVPPSIKARGLAKDFPSSITHALPRNAPREEANQLFHLPRERRYQPYASSRGYYYQEEV
jgi:hypothetical protein